MNVTALLKNKMKCQISYYCLLSLVLSPSIATALDFEINGFGSFVVGKSISDELLSNGKRSSYLVDPTLAHKDNGDHNNHSRYDNSWAVLPDSNFGLQASVLSDYGLSATVQLRFQGAEYFVPRVEWAYLTYQLLDNLDVKLGRQQIPLYFFSDYKDVGYAYHWLRPPIDVYGEAISNYDGVSLNYQFEFQEIDSELQLYYGNFKNKNASTWKIKSKFATGVTLTSTYDWLTLRASYNRAESYSDVSNNLITVPQQTISKNEPTKISFSSLAFMADFEYYFFGAEYVHLNFAPYIEAINMTALPAGVGLLNRSDERDAFMITGGYRFREYTFHLTYSQRKSSASIPADPRLQSMHDMKRQTWTGGVRWDFYENLALKAEISHAQDKSDKIIQSVIGKSLQNTVIAIGVDFVF